MKLPRRSSAALLGLAALAPAGCGSAGSGPGAPPPLAPHLRVVTDVARCDRGDARFCGRELVVVASGAAARGGDTVLMAAEHAALTHAGWSASGGQVAGEASASSPGARRYVSYGPAAIDLAAIAKGNVKRDSVIVAALRREAAAHAAALVVVVQAGAG